MNYCVVALYDHDKYTRGDVISRHKTHELAEKALNKGAYSTFRGIKEEEQSPVGRPPKMADGKPRTIYIDDANWEKAKELGNGKPSEGIRIALSKV
ncbi:hypothetical protein [Nitrosovibrio sp. Nv6]|uniref:hypothetical protein n=1 Tax=Nitrosovibrio sp. Nv6 TaxID=1855340 RepID=UPI0008B74925|nr:hypothetical protein [Nitrosovibrio sp. Nv6]SEO78107.1 hypothetical protein SAMN05216316_1079 [Nitrosovibrio sp. Nv6]